MKKKHRQNIARRASMPGGLRKQQNPIHNLPSDKRQKFNESSCVCKQRLLDVGDSACSKCWCVDGRMVD